MRALAVRFATCLGLAEQQGIDLIGGIGIPAEPPSSAFLNPGEALGAVGG
jgi:hypothetical protein